MILLKKRPTEINVGQVLSRDKTYYKGDVTLLEVSNKWYGSTDEVGDKVQFFEYTVGFNYIIISGTNFDVPDGLAEFLKGVSGGYRKSNRRKISNRKISKRRNISKFFKEEILK